MQITGSFGDSVNISKFIVISDLGIIVSNHCQFLVNSLKPIAFTLSIRSFAFSRILHSYEWPIQRTVFFRPLISATVRKYFASLEYVHRGKLFIAQLKSQMTWSKNSIFFHCATFPPGNSKQFFHTSQLVCDSQE